MAEVSKTERKRQARKAWSVARKDALKADHWSSSHHIRALHIYQDKRALKDFLASRGLYGIIDVNRRISPANKAIIKKEREDQENQMRQKRQKQQKGETYTPIESERNMIKRRAEALADFEHLRKTGHFIRPPPNKVHASGIKSYLKNHRMEDYLQEDERKTAVAASSDRFVREEEGKQLLAKKMAEMRALNEAHRTGQDLSKHPLASVRAYQQNVDADRAFHMRRIQQNEERNRLQRMATKKAQSTEVYVPDLD